MRPDRRSVSRRQNRRPLSRTVRCPLFSWHPPICAIVRRGANPPLAYLHTRTQAAQLAYLHTSISAARMSFVNSLQLEDAAGEAGGPGALNPVSPAPTGWRMSDRV